MKRERFYLGLTLGLFVILLTAFLLVGFIKTSYAGMPAVPHFLAPPLPTPTLAPLPPGYSPPDRGDVDAQVDRPDLIVESIVVEPSSPYVFNKATVKVTIANLGSGPMTIGNNFYTDLYIGGIGVPSSGERGITCQSGNCDYPASGFKVIDSVLPWGCQAQWVEGVGARYTLTATVVFSGVKSYYLYAQIDTPEQGHDVGYVYEDPDGGEYNNIYPTDSSVWAQTKAPGRFTESKHQQFFDNYASSLEILPTSKVLTDINDVQIVSDAFMQLGSWEEPPKCWGTVATPPDAYCPDYTTDYNVLEPDTRLNTVETRSQSKVVVASDGVTNSLNVVAVWEDQRTSTQYPDIYLRWSNSETDDGEYHYRQDWGTSANEVKVNDNATLSKQQNPAVAMSQDGDVVVVWQDNRNDPDPISVDVWDIYIQQYHLDAGGLVPVGTNQIVQTSVCPEAVETFPDVTVDQEGMFYVVCQSMCTNQSAVWASKGQPPSPGALINWDPWRYVVDPSGHERHNPKIDVSYTTGITNLQVIIIDPDPLAPVYEYTYDLIDIPVLAVTWYEDRGLGTGEDIYVTYNLDQMATNFAEDAQVNQDSAVQAYNKVQDQPVLAVSQAKTDATVKARTNSGAVLDIELTDIPVPALQVAWRDYRESSGSDVNPIFLGPGNDPNIYYAYCPFKLDEITYELYLPIQDDKVVTEIEQKVNLHDDLGWQDYAKQLQPSISAWTYPDFLSGDREIPYEVYIVWTDGRNYDNRNYDIYLWVYGDAHDGLRNYVLNDDAKIHDFDPVFFEGYSADKPPAAMQVRPSVDSVIGGRLFLGWQDNRTNNFGADINDIYFTRTPHDQQDYGPIGGVKSRWVGAYLSQAFDSCPGLEEGSPDCDTTWFKIDYGGVTPEKTWIAIQTRLGNTINELLNAEWYPETLVWEPQGGYYVPLRGYLGPGAYIVGPGGQWPQARYAQYRVNLWGLGNTPIVYYVSLFHGSASAQGTYGNVYLPIIVKNHTN